MDSTTRELASIVIALRRDLAVGVRPQRGEVTYVIEDEAAGRFYRVGEPEYAFLSLLDGRRPFADVFAQAAATSGADALTEQQAASLCRWLVEAGLASTEASRATGRLLRSQDAAAKRRRAGRWNLLFWKTPLFHPDGLFRALAWLFGWVVSWPCGVLLALLLALLLAAGVVAAGIGFGTTGGHTLTANDGLWIAGAWLALRLVHEGAHGLVARSLGCPVREAGLTWILLVPLPYVDVTSAWRLDRRGDRMLVAAAGMLAELALAAVAAIVWSLTPPGPLHEHAFHLMLSGSVVTVLFNANPLMRFDGYHLLADACDLPNLAGHGQQAVKAIARRWALGLNAPTPRWPEGRTGFIVAYGVAALVWRVVLCASLAIAAEAMLFGAGVVLALAAVGLWLLWPAAKLLKFVAVGSKTEQPPRLRFAATLAVLATLGGGLALVPWEDPIDAAAVYDFDPVVEVRSDAAGFVTTIDVQPGQRVAAGQRLLTLRNPELIARRGQVFSELAGVELKARRNADADEVAAWQVQQETAAALRQTLADLDARIAALVVTAPADGILLDDDLDARLGRYVPAGQTLLMLGEGPPRLIALVPQRQRDALAVGQPVGVHLDGRGVDGFRPTMQAAAIERISPQATTAVRWPLLTASAGGPLPVRVLSAKERASLGDEAGVRLLQPHYEARLTLTSTDAADTDPAPRLSDAVGRPATVRLHGRRVPLGQHVLTVAQDWWDTHRAARMTQ